jgi:zinc/manganese transport system substrate-binding protein
MMIRRHLLSTALLGLAFIVTASSAVAAADKIQVVTSFSDYAEIARVIGGDKVNIDYISQGDQDPHFVAPKPSLALKLKKADIWITTGLDLEMWSTTLLDKARNKKIMDGAKGFVTVHNGIHLQQKHETAMTRTEGDIHLYGNPHIHTGPLNWKKIAENILIGLIKNDPNSESYYMDNYTKFCDRLDRQLFGDELVEMIGAERLEKLLLSGGFYELLEKSYKGEPLKKHLGGWLKKAEQLRGMKVIAYHKNWAYFTQTFGLEVVEYIEHKPGIPPSAKHVQEIARIIDQQNIRLMLVASYFEHNTPKMIEKRTGIKAVFLPFSCKGNDQVPDNFALIDYWLDSMLDGLKSSTQ